MGDITKYLEGQYDGTGFQRGAQQIVDLQRSLEISQRVEETQLQAWEEEESRIAQIYGETGGDKLGELMEAYAEEDRYNEYLVHGAVLTCDQATLEDFELPDGGRVILNMASAGNPEERRKSKLEVKENAMSFNDKIYATVRDTVKGMNIMPFQCNCKQKADRATEVEKIMADSERSEYGVCRHLMQLNEKWDNTPRETGYMRVENRIPTPDREGVSGILDLSYDELLANGEQEGITMTSVLFCKHGGLIRAITSGQEEVIVEEKMMVEEVNEEIDVSNPQAVKEYMWKFFRDAGFSEVAVAGILANAYQESQFVPEKKSSLEGYFGLFQLGGDRKIAFVAAGREWAEQQGLPEEEWDDGWKNLQFQCEYALQEYYYPGDYGWFDRGINLQINGLHIKAVGSKENFETAEDPSFAALLWAASFERCYKGDKYKEDGITFFVELQHQQERYDQARIIYEEFCGNGS